MRSKNHLCYFVVALIVTLSPGGVHSQAFGPRLDFPHHYTFASPVPAGCLTLVPTAEQVPASADLSFDQVITVSENGLTADFRLRVWRFACFEPNRSVIMLNVDRTAGSPLVTSTPITAFLSDGNSQITNAFIYYMTGEASAYQGNGFNAVQDGALEGLVLDGISYVVDAASDVPPEFYNGLLNLQMQWVDGQIVNAPVFTYDFNFDVTQYSAPPFHGRYSGQWVTDDLPRTGLQLMFFELPMSDRAVVFAVWFTYLNGVPIWVVGNADYQVGSNEIQIDMLGLSGGGFITRPGTFTSDSVFVENVGTMTIRANHCNEIEADLDFSASGEGSASLTLERLIRIAGYDCDQTQ